MWSPTRPTNNEPLSSAQESASTPAPRNAAPVPVYKEGTYIGKSFVIKGEMSGDDQVHIDGRIEGPISLRDGRVNIGRDAVVMSNVQAGEVIVRGTLEGNTNARDRVEVHSGGSLTGDVKAARVTVELGAYFHGRVDMSRPDPKAHLDDGKSDKKPARTEETSLALTY
ncbi:MAG TPA: polymer-forming cytoskeletal protein [Terriglobales bacterium]|nr:polymer-forming cytoskeletal protein [Terriglobales bacterium]